MGASGQSGLLGDAADWFDGKKVVGVVAVIATAIGLIASGGEKPTDCDQDNGLQGVYNHDRFKVLDTCVGVTGTVIAWRHEHDGDYHVSMVMDGEGWTNDLNVKRQKGYTVVEFVPRGPHINFRVAQRLRMLGTKVLDLQHGDHKTTGWVELHPVFTVKELDDGADYAPDPKSLAPPTEEDAKP
jgi:hypothetical protein